MKQITANKIHEGKPIEVVMRFGLRLVYIMASNNPLNNQFIGPLIDKIRVVGGEVDLGRQWVRVNLFAKDKEVKLNNGSIINVEDLGDIEVDKVLVQQFTEILKKGGFEVKVEDITFGGKR